MVIVGESGERGLGFPSHIGVGVAKTVFEHLDHAITGHVQVRTRVSAMRQMVGCEGVRERSVDAFGGQQVEPVFEGPAGQEPHREQAQFSASDKDDLGLMSQDHHHSKRRFFLPSFPLDRLTFSFYTVTR
jgi:hypothetical protein